MKQRKDYETRQRDAVLALFKNQPQRGMSAQEAYEQLRASGTAIGRTTVYRTVARLCEAGQLIALGDLRAAGGAPKTYQHRGQSRHISVRCSGCGMMAALTCDAVEAFEEHLFADHGFRLEEAECLLNGLCGDCQRQQPHDDLKGSP